MTFISRKTEAVRLFSNKFSGQKIGSSLVYLEKTESTNLYALDNISSLESGTVIIAETQTAGRGRKGRSWHSGELLGLYMTIALKSGALPRSLPLLNLAASLAAFEAISDMLSGNSKKHNIELKWPNDILWSGRKICGVLSERRMRKGSEDAIAVGIGINLNYLKSGFPEDVRESAASLKMIDEKARQPDEAASNVIDKFIPLYESLMNGESARIISQWLTHSPSSMGARLRIIGDGIEFIAVSEGLDGEGFLIVRRENDRLQRILSADIVSIREE